jgi:SAM-dependent methyltransferase
MDWTTYLHAIRRRETELIFGGCPPRAFRAALELGAGDGYQSTLLQAFVEQLVVTEWDVTLLLDRRSERLEVKPCDAETVGAVFPPAAFDLVFSSNLLEHLPHPEQALRSIHGVLKDHGVTVHVMPSPFWKLCNLGLFFPWLIVRVLRRLVRGPAGRSGAPPCTLPNNPKTPSADSAWSRRLWPAPHGAYRGHIQELWAYREARWLEEFRRAGFEVVRVMKGPVCSGYGLGWDRLRRLLERAGFTSEYVYVAIKVGCRSPYEAYFTEAQVTRDAIRTARVAGRSSAAAGS